MYVVSMVKIEEVEFTEVFPDDAKRLCDGCACADDRLFLAKGIYQLLCEKCLYGLAGIIQTPVSLN